MHNTTGGVVSYHGGSLQGLPLALAIAAKLDHLHMLRLIAISTSSSVISVGNILGRRLAWWVIIKLIHMLPTRHISSQYTFNGLSWQASLLKLWEPLLFLNFITSHACSIQITSMGFETKLMALLSLEQAFEIFTWRHGFHLSNLPASSGITLEQWGHRGPSWRLSHLLESAGLPWAAAGGGWQLPGNQLSNRCWAQWCKHPCSIAIFQSLDHAIESVVPIVTWIMLVGDMWAGAQSFWPCLCTVSSC